MTAIDAMIIDSLGIHFCHFVFLFYTEKNLRVKFYYLLKTTFQRVKIKMIFVRTGVRPLVWFVATGLVPIR